MNVSDLIAAIDGVRTDGFQTTKSNRLTLTEHDWKSVRDQIMAEYVTEWAQVTSGPPASFVDVAYEPDTVGTFYGCPVRIGAANTMQTDQHTVPLDKSERDEWRRRTQC